MFPFRGTFVQCPTHDSHNDTFKAKGNKENESRKKKIWTKQVWIICIPILTLWFFNVHENLKIMKWIHKSNYFGVCVWVGRHIVEEREKTLKFVGKVNIVQFCFYLFTNILGCKTFGLNIKLQIGVLYILCLIYVLLPETLLRLWSLFQMTTSSNCASIHKNKFI